MAIRSFNQPAPVLDDPYATDRPLRSYLARALPDDVRSVVDSDLRKLARLITEELYPLQLEDRASEPVLTQWDAWGERVDRVDVTRVWQVAERIAAERGIVATAYELEHGRFSRLHQLALAYLFTPATDIYSCPLAMTDGAARTLIASGNRALVDRALPRLTSRDPARFWTSGQWMTETTGGSDVGRSETVARRDEQGAWRLYGRKWFTSAVTSQMALTLARPEGNDSGGHGLALFYVELRDESGRLRNIEVNRLKDKLGTRKVPTAELTLDGTPAELVCGTTNGVRHIAPMLNITRLWNGISAVALMRRGLALALDYAKKRVAFGAPLADKPLHVDTLAGMQAELEGALQLAFRVGDLLGRDEAGEIGERDGRLLRVLTPIMKLVTARQAVAVASEVLEAFGGAGYVEDTGLPVLLRDAQVLSIWEGTTNVLSLDTLRALGASGDIGIVREEITRASQSVRDEGLALAVESAARAADHAQAWLAGAHARSSAEVEAGARRFAMTLGRAVEVALVAEQAQWSIEHERDGRARAAARRLAAAPLDLVVDGFDAEETRLLLMG